MIHPLGRPRGGKKRRARFGKKVHPVDVRDRELIAMAHEFCVTEFLGVGRYARWFFKDLVAAQAHRNWIATQGHDRLMIYAFTDVGGRQVQTFVE